VDAVSVANDKAGSGISFQEEQITLAGGLKVPPMGVGAWQWGDSFGYWSYSPDMDPELQGIFDTCMDSGITLVDTAEVYGLGKSERLLGNFEKVYLTNTPSEPPREKTKPIVATKFAPLPWRVGRRAVVEACRDSLARLGRTQIDLYQIHFPGVWQNEAYWDGLADCYEQGLVRAVGVSNYGSDMLRKVHAKLAARNVPLATNQIQFSLLYRTPMEELAVYDTCKELNVKILAYSPLAQGLLTGKYSADDSSNYPKGPRRLLYRRTLPKAAPIIDRLRILADKYDKQPAQVALNWCVSKGVIPIPGASRLRQATSNIGALGWRLTADDVAELDTVAKRSNVRYGAGIPLPD